MHSSLFAFGLYLEFSNRSPQRNGWIVASPKASPFTDSNAYANIDIANSSGIHTYTCIQFALMLHRAEYFKTAGSLRWPSPFSLGMLDRFEARVLRATLSARVAVGQIQRQGGDRRIDSSLRACPECIAQCTPPQLTTASCPRWCTAFCVYFSLLVASFDYFSMLSHPGLCSCHESVHDAQACWKLSRPEDMSLFWLSCFLSSPDFVGTPGYHFRITNSVSSFVNTSDNYKWVTGSKRRRRCFASTVPKRLLLLIWASRVYSVCTPRSMKLLIETLTKDKAALYVARRAGTQIYELSRTTFRLDVRSDTLVAFERVCQPSYCIELCFNVYTSRCTDWIEGRKMWREACFVVVFLWWRSSRDTYYKGELEANYFSTLEVSSCVPMSPLWTCEWIFATATVICKFLILKWIRKIVFLALLITIMLFFY